MISSVGDFAFSTTLVLWIATRLAERQPWAPLAVSGEFLALSAPVAVVGPLAGVFVDRWDKRRTMLTMDLLRALLVSLLIPLATPLGDTLPLAWRLAAIYAVIAAVSICAQFFGPARLALLGDIVPAAQQARASGLMFMTLSIGVTLGPALAAPLYLACGPILALGFNALSFLVSFVTLRAVDVPPAMPHHASAHLRHISSEFGVGLRFFFGHPVLRTLLIVTALTLAGSSAINALGIFFLTDNLHSSPDLYGALNAATGLGVLVGSTLAIGIVPRLGAARSYWLCTIVVGGLLVLYARQTTFACAATILFLLGLPSAGLNVAIGPLMLTSAPRELVGRAVAILTPATSLAATVSAALVGVLASTLLRDFQVSLFDVTLGPYDTVYLLSGLLIGASGIYALLKLSGRGKPESRRDRVQGMGASYR
jgi:MFS family permease